MKKLTVFILVISLAFVCGCSLPVPEDEVLISLGEYTSGEYYTSGGFQDFTDYAKYKYESIDLEGNRYLKKMESADVENLKAHIENFEEWIEAIELSDSKNEVLTNYDFDTALISEEDYLFIYDDPDYMEFGCYDIYFFDTQTSTLYYFHNNI